MKSWKKFFQNSTKKKTGLLFWVTTFFLLLVLFFSLSMGAAELSFKDIWTAIKEGADSGVAGRIFWYVRLPRTLACVLSGAALATAGVVIQNVLSN